MGGYALWFIPVLALAEFIYIMLCKVSSDKRIIWCAILISLFCGHQLSKLELQNPFNILLTFTSLGFYGAGNQMKNLLINLDKSKVYIMLVCSGLLSLTCFLNTERPQWFICKLASFWTYSAAFGGTIFICSLCIIADKRLPTIVLKPFSYLGRNTYVILAFHQVVMQWLSKSNIIPRGIILTAFLWAIMILLIEGINRYTPQVLGKSK